MPHHETFLPSHKLICQSRPFALLLKNLTFFREEYFRLHTFLVRATSLYMYLFHLHLLGLLHLQR